MHKFIIKIEIKLSQEVHLYLIFGKELILRIIFTFINKEFELKIEVLDCIGFNNEKIKKQGNRYIEYLKRH